MKKHKDKIVKICMICKKKMYLYFCGRNRKTCSIECRHTLQSILMTGKGNSMFGKHHSKKTIQKLSEKGFVHNRGVKNPMFGKKRPDISFRMKNGGAIKAMLGNRVYMNNPEKYVFKIIKSLKLNFEYSGNKSVCVGGYNPDFIDKNDKKIIEVFGDYWHNLSEYKKRDQIKLRKYKKLGYKVLIIWEKEVIQDYNNVLKNKILKFSKN